MSKSGLAYIRDYYQVPAYLGVRVRLEDGRWAEIVGSDRAYLEVLVDGDRTKSIVHPNGCGYRPEGTGQRVDELVAERDTLVARLTEVERDKATAVEALRSAQRDVERWEADWQTERRVTEATETQAEQWRVSALKLEGEWYATIDRAATAEARAGALAAVLTDLIESEPEPCRLDHHGYCQEHFLSQPCVVAAARAALAAAGDGAKGGTE